MVDNGEEGRKAAFRDWFVARHTGFNPSGGAATTGADQHRAEQDRNRQSVQGPLSDPIQSNRPPVVIPGRENGPSPLVRGAPAPAMTEAEREAACRAYRRRVCREALEIGRIQLANDGLGWLPFLFGQRRTYLDEHGGVNFSSTGLIDGHRPIRRHQHLRRLRRWYMAKLDAEIAALEARCSHGDYPTTERVPILNIILMDEDQAHRRWAYAIALRDQARAGRFLDPFSPTPRIDPPGAARGDHASATTRPPVTGLPATLSLAGLDAAMRREFLRIVTRALRHDRYPETDGFERAHLALALEPEAPPL